MKPEIILAIAAIAAVITSVVSIIFTVNFSKQQMLHNRNSLKPICEIKLSDYENRIAVSIANVGTGPLTITEIMCSDTKLKSSILLRLMPNIKQYWTTFTEDITGWTIPVSGKLILIELQPENDDIRQLIRSVLAKINIYIKYTDVYGTIFEKHKLLDFFARTLTNATKSKYASEVIGTPKMVVNGKPLFFDQPPIVESEKEILAPIRDIAESLGAKVGWDLNTQTITIEKKDTVITLKVDSDVLVKNSISIKLDAPVRKVNNRILVPIRAVAENLGAKVDWDLSTKLLSITDIDQ